MDAGPRDLRARKRCSHAKVLLRARKRVNTCCTNVTFSCDEKHTDLELVIRKDYQLFCGVSTLAFRSGVQNSAVLVGLAEELLCS